MTTEQKIQYIADHYGYEAQSRQAVEELSELITAICKHNRATDRTRLSEARECPEKDAIIEEMADVMIMMCQMQYLFGICRDDLLEKAEQKLDRQIERIKSMICGQRLKWED